MHVTDLGDFEAWLCERDRSAATVRSYLADLHDFAAWFCRTNGEALSVERLTPTDVREYRAFLQSVRRVRAATVRRRLMALRAYCRWGLEVGRVEHDATARLRFPGATALAPRWLTRQEQWRLVREAERARAAADTPSRQRLALRDWALVVFLLHTGLRIAEACALEVQDVEIGERTGWVQVRDGKGTRARQVPLNAEARRALRDWLEERGTDSGRLFGGLTPSGAYRRLATLGRRAGVKVHPHTLRHTFAKNLVDSGTGLERVAALLGHSNLNTTRAYITPSPHDLERAVQGLEGG